MHDRGWKGIMFGYGGVDQWRIYNPRTRRIHVLASVSFDKGFSYYDTSHEVTHEDDDDDAEMGDVWKEADDDKVGKVIAGKQVIRRDGAAHYSTPQSRERSAATDDEEEGDDNSRPESAANNDHPLPNQPMPPPAVPSNTSCPLNDISGTDILLPADSFPDLEGEEDIPESPNIFFGDNTEDQPGSSRQLRTKSGVIKRVDYKNPRRRGKAMSVLQPHNVFHAKRIPQSHTPMVRVMTALTSGDNLGLSHYTEPQNYREARISPHWLSWKAAMDLKIQSKPGRQKCLKAKHRAIRHGRRDRAKKEK